ncbi:MAG: DUF423 domain-containing protein [Verrucomicrobiota bacterium]
MEDEKKCSPGSRAFPFLVGSLFAFVGVCLGAFGAHALKAKLVAAGTLAAWETAVEYQFWHALALIALAFRPVGWESKGIDWAVRLFIVGVVLFSGSIYLLALKVAPWLGPVTPIGGICLLIAWGILVVFAGKRLKQPAG